MSKGEKLILWSCVLSLIAGVILGVVLFLGRYYRNDNLICHFAGTSLVCEDYEGVGNEGR